MVADAEAILAAHDRGQEGEIETLLAKSDVSLEEFHVDVEDWVAEIHTHLGEEDARLDRSSAVTTSLMIGAAAVSLVVGLTLAITLSRAISKPLVALASVASQAISGDLVVRSPNPPSPWL